MPTPIINTILRRVVNTETSFWITVDTGKAGSASNQFVLPLESVGTYNMSVAWGDGSTDTITAYNQAAVTHTYPSTGTYDIKITGTCYGWRFVNAGDKLKLTNIKRWGVGFRISNLTSAFMGCANMVVTAIDNLDLTGITTLENMFRGCTALTTVPSITTWTMPVGLVGIHAMFKDATNFNQTLSGWDTSKITTGTAVFNGCTNFNSPININVSNVTLLNSWFGNCTNFNQDISGWDIRAVTTMTDMFVSNNGALSDANYTAFLVRCAYLSTQIPTIKSNVALHGGSSKYTSAGATAKTTLAGFGWTFTDGGLR